MDYNIPKDILVFIIDSDSACYLFHSSTYIHQSLCSVCDEEFEMVMQDKEKEADKLLSGWSKLDKEERQTYIKRMSLDTELVSIINGRMVYNNLKKQSFIYKQALRKTYKDGISIRDSFMQSEKFELTNQNKWKDFNKNWQRL